MRTRSRILVALALATPFVVVAQAPVRQSDSVPSRCWGAKPLPYCRRWVVSEFGYEKGIITTHGRDEDFGHAFVITLGRMTNTSTTKAAGFTGTVYLGSQGPGFRAERRLRTWTSPSTSTDWSAGLAAQPMAPAVNDWALGVTGGGALNYEWVAFTGRANLMYGERGIATGLSGGLRAGGKVGTLGAVLFAAGVGALIILIAGASDY